MVTFNFNMMFMRELGPDALPREWYTIPGHKHYNEWLVTTYRDEVTWAPLQALYNIIGAENWSECRLAQGPPGVSLGCARSPPTQPLSTEGSSIFFPLLGVALLCCGCMGAVSYHNFMKRTAAQTPGVQHNSAEDPSVEMSNVPSSTS